MSTWATIRRVCHAEILGAPNARALIAEYAAECSILQIGEIHPQAEIYAMLERSGHMATFGVYTASEELIGFATVLTTICPHYGRMLATVESLFVRIDHRPGGIGRALMDAIEQHAAQQDCTAVLYSARAHSRFSALLAASDEYIRTNEVYCRSVA